MSLVETNRTLGDIVTSDPSSARVLDRYGLDYCCGGRRTLADACASAGIDVDEVVAALEAHEPGPTPEWASMGPVELVDHLESTHHRYLHAELPRLAALVAEVHGVHGQNHPELTEIEATFGELHAELAPHLMKEERVLFPMIRELAAASTAPQFHCGSLRNPISVMMSEHDSTGVQLERLRALTGDFSPPADACASYRALYDGLAELEADTHLHVHKENNVLFPAVLELERRFASS